MVKKKLKRESKKKSMKKPRDLTEGNIPKNLLVLAFPIIIGMILHNLFNIVDTFYVAKLGSDALAALSLSFPVFVFMIALGTGLTIGVSSLVARTVGSKSKRNIKNKLISITENGFIVAFFIYVFFAIVGIATVEPLFTFMGASASVLPLIKQYMIVIYLGNFIMFFGMVAGGLLYGSGNTLFPALGLVVSTVVNILIDPLFIFGGLGIPAMGVMGAAIATIIARFIGMLFVFGYLFSGKAIVKLQFRKFLYNAKIMKEILVVGIPASLSQMLSSIGLFFLNKIVAVFGTAAIAAFGLGYKFDLVAMLPAMGIAIATITIVGQMVGAKKTQKAKIATWTASIMVFIFMETIGLLLFLFPEFFMGIFTKDAEVIMIGIKYLKIVALSYGFIGITMICSSAFQAIGKAMPALFLVILRLVIVAIPIGYGLSLILGWGVNGVWYGIVLANIAVGLSAPYWFKKMIDKFNPKKFKKSDLQGLM
ncbi:MATE family efflux transporter [Nanoarchaeota archaeon]